MLLIFLLSLESWSSRNDNSSKRWSTNCCFWFHNSMLAVRLVPQIMVWMFITLALSLPFMLPLTCSQFACFIFLRPSFKEPDALCGMTCWIHLIYTWHIPKSQTIRKNMSCDSFQTAEEIAEERMEFSKISPSCGCVEFCYYFFHCCCHCYYDVFGRCSSSGFASMSVVEFMGGKIPEEERKNRGRARNKKCGR